LSALAAEIVRTKDTGTLQYDTYFNDDQSECVVVERYRDSEAAIEHAANLGELFPAILGTVSVVPGELLGEPSAELRAKRRNPVPPSERRSIQRTKKAMPEEAVAAVSSQTASPGGPPLEAARTDSSRDSPRSRGIR
jgi:hypothetical protein